MAEGDSLKYWVLYVISGIILLIAGKFIDTEFVKPKEGSNLHSPPKNTQILKLMLQKHRTDSLTALWEKMKTDVAKRKNMPIQEETDSTQNENQEEVEETNLTSQ